MKFIQENKRYLLAIFANIVALCSSIWWLVDSNWNSESSFEIEPIVTSVALVATLLGINFVNDKLSKPLLRVRMSNSIAQHPLKGLISGICITVENHSIMKAFIGKFQIHLPEQKEVIQFLYEGFTGQILPKVILEPGQAFSFNIVKVNLTGAPGNSNKYGDFIVTTDVGHEFTIPAKIVRPHITNLLKG